MKKIILVLIAGIVIALAGWGGYQLITHPEEISNFGISVPEFHQATSSLSLGLMNTSLGGAGSASSTFSWKGGDTGRAMYDLKCRWATCTVTFLFQYSDDLTNWYNDTFAAASSTVGQTPTTTFQLARRLYNRTPGIDRATTSESVLLEGLRNVKFIRVLMSRNASDGSEDTRATFSIIKEVQQ